MACLLCVGVFGCCCVVGPLGAAFLLATTFCIRVPCDVYSGGSWYGLLQLLTQLTLMTANMLVWGLSVMVCFCMALCTRELPSGCYVFCVLCLMSRMLCQSAVMFLCLVAKKSLVDVHTWYHMPMRSSEHAQFRTSQVVTGNEWQHAS